MTEKIVISLGGSVISGDPINMAYMGKFASTVGSLKTSGTGIVVGGGRISRSYIKAMREIGAPEYMMDLAGIMITRANATVVASMLKIQNYYLPMDVETASTIMGRDGIVVMGGTEPGHTTDTVAMLLAERIGCNVMINLSNVDGVYDMDPSKHKDARLLERLDYESAMKLSMKPGIGAGPSVFLDPVSISIARRSHIKVYVVNGKDPSIVERILSGKEVPGSVIWDHS